MNSSAKPNVVKPIIVAVALALSGSAYAASVGDVVTTRADQNIDQQYGRDSVYAFSPDAKPLKPEQTSSQHFDLFGKVKSYAANVWDKTEHFTGAIWDKTTGMLPHKSATVAQYDVQPYGRAGGYVGADRIAVLSNNSTSLSANSENVVKTGESAGNVADTRMRSDVPVAQDRSQPSPDTIQDEAKVERSMSSSMQGDQGLNNQMSDASATKGSGYTEERDLEGVVMIQEISPIESGDVSATEGSGYTDNENTR